MSGSEPEVRGLNLLDLAAALQQANPDTVARYLENEQRNRHRIEATSLWLTAGLVLSIAGMATWLAATGHDWVAGVVFTTTLLGIGTIFILRQRPQRLS